MKTSVERVDETTVKLSVTVEPERVSAAMAAAALALGRTAKIPGFRPGRVPRKVLEARLGRDALRQEAVREALPTFYGEAAQSAELQVVGPPKFDLEHFEEGSEAVFSATVEVRPEIEVPDYQGLQVAHPDWEVTDDEVDEQLDALRQRHAQLDTVERPVANGDFIVVSVTGTRDGERIEEVSGEDLLYQLGTGGADAPLDNAALGANAGDVVTFGDSLDADYEGELAGAELSFTALIKEVKQQQLPELDDDFALTASEFDTIDELRDDVRTRLADRKLGYARASLRSAIVEAVSALVEVAVPKGMVGEEVRLRLNRMAADAQHNNMELDAYLSAIGSSIEDTLMRIQDEAARTVKAQLVIDAIGRAEGVEVTQQDIELEINRQAQRLNKPPQELADFMLHPDRIGALVSDAFRRTTIDRIVDAVDVLSAPPDPEPAPEVAPEAAPAADAAVDDG